MIKEYEKLLEQIYENKKNKIVFWGASLFLEEFLKENDLDKFNIVGIIDKNSERWGQKVGNYEIFSPDILKKHDDAIVILSIYHKNEQRYLELKKFLAEEYPKTILAENFTNLTRYKLKKWFYEKTNENLDLENPKTYNEKIQWLKLYDSTPIKTKLADKYLVRNWIKENIGEQYLIPIYGVWDSFDEIDFNMLPEQFVLKCNHGSGYNYIVKDKSNLDKEEVKKIFDKWMNENYAYKEGYELHYSKIEKKIFAEKYIKLEISDNEYQVWCFHGKLKYISCESCKTSTNAYRTIFSPDWEVENFIIKPSYYTNFPIPPKKPEFLEDLKRISEILAKDFIHVRIDFIDINKRVYFREMTFTSGSGLCKWKPEEYNLVVGSLIQLEN